MLCLACRRFGSGHLCSDCSSQLRNAPDRFLDGGLRIRSAYLHLGPARLLVHNLKYRGIAAAGQVLAQAMADLIPPASTLIPVPRIAWRKLRHGIDPATVLASQLADLTGGRKCDLLVQPILGASQAKSSRDKRMAPMFNAMEPPKGPVVLVDDVVTTGGTVFNAWCALGSGPALVVSATSAGGQVSGGRYSVGRRDKAPGR